LCVETLDIFIWALGTAAGNLALTGLTTGGIYIGGGIAPRIKSILVSGAFMKAFTNKGRYKDLIKSIPVKVILNDKAALLGAAWRATQEVSPPV
jgi:glucokinase